MQSTWLRLFSFVMFSDERQQKGCNMFNVTDAVFESPTMTVFN